MREEKNSEDILIRHVSLPPWMYHQQPSASSIILGENYSKCGPHAELEAKLKHNWDSGQIFEMTLHRPSYMGRNITWSNHVESWTHLKHLHCGTLLFTHTFAGLPWKQGIYCCSLLTKCCSLTADQTRPCYSVPRMRHCLNQQQISSHFCPILEWIYLV